MDKAKQGNSVKVHYKGSLDDGNVFDSSHGREPLEFTIGEGRVIAGFEDAVIGMVPGDQKTVRIACEQAYGPRREDMVAVFNSAQFPENIVPAVGQILQLKRDDGMLVQVMITNVTGDQVTLDANHPLAGQDLIFDIQLVEITS
ncbi:MAG: peptidylprolyl isomerase [Syntrophaceae bacterium]|nr:peptidylprolyl isomerase [Syntrophaceae bacterium]